MAYVRHLPRHLRKTVNDHIVAHLTALGWFNDPATLNSRPVKMYLRRIRDSELIEISGNAVGIFWGAESNDEAEELGGGLMKFNGTFYVDVIASEDGVGLALSSDIKDLLTGRAPGTARLLQLNDYSTAPPTALPDHLVEFVEVKRQRPEQNEVEQFWQVLVVDVEVVFPGEDS